VVVQDTQTVIPLFLLLPVRIGRLSPRRQYTWNHTRQKRACLLIKGSRGWEDDIEAYIEVAMLGSTCGDDRHSSMLDAFELARGDDFSRRRSHTQYALIEVCDEEFDTANGIYEWDVLFHKQIVSVSLELCVLDLLEDKHHIARLHSRLVTSLASEYNLAAMLHTLVDVNLHTEILSLGIEINEVLQRRPHTHL
jgi:hypothetical protein